MSENSFEAINILQSYLTKDLSIDELEKYEKKYKNVLKNIFSKGLSGEGARKLAQIQKSIGLIFKYKPYTIKASNPLGYSIFFHNPREGFSFQQHTSHKTEVFHILDVLPGSYVFICKYSDWEKIYDRGSFSRWLEGEPDPKYDQFKYEPKAGDVIVLDKLGIVHTVVGCTLEEFATASTDMVDRLHDQNKGKIIPNNFTRKYSEDKLKSIVSSFENRIVEIISGGHRTKEVRPEKIKGGLKIRLADMGLIANKYIIEKNGCTDFQRSQDYAISLTVTSGKGNVVIVDENEDLKRVSGIELEKGDNIIVSPGMRYEFCNTGKEVLILSEHKITPQVGLV